MGVQGLWSILNCSGKDIDISTLEGRVLAVDLSIWLNQALKSANESPNAHLQLLFNRICKLLFYKIKPVFVFDGPAPSIKKRAIELRRRSRQLKNDRVEQIKSQILNILMKKNIIERKKIPVKRNKEIVDIFHIPEETSEWMENLRPIDCEFSDTAEDYIGHFDSIDGVDVESECFHVLPLEVRHEILRTITMEKRYGLDSRQESYNDLKSGDFSDLQIKRLLDRNSLHQRIGDLRTTMNERDCRNIIDSSKLRGISEDLSHGAILAKKIISHDNGYLMLIDQSDDDLIMSLSASKREAMVANVKRKTVDEDSIQKSVEPTEYSFEEPVSSLSERDMSCIMDSVSKLKKNTTDNTSLDIGIKSGGDTFINSRIERADGENLIEETLYPLIERESLNSDAGSAITGNDDVTLRDPGPEIEPDSVAEASVSQINPDDVESDDEEIESDTDFIDVPEIDGQGLDTRTSENNEHNSEVQKPLYQPLMDELVCSSVPDHSEISSSNKSFDQSVNQEFFTDPQAWNNSSDALLSSLYAEESKLEHQSVAVSERYFQEAKELLRLFGIPYVESPAEAEAQCAFLETIGLTHGSITEDSDIWLFGGKTVYKHMFTTGFAVREYNSSDIYRKLGLNRDLMICVALLSGGDYTPGIYGVGPVNAMEILAEFSDPDVSMTNFQVLQHYKNWWDEHKKCDKLSEKSERRRFLRFELDKNFPDPTVYESYNKPLVDESKEPLLWSPPSIDKLIEYVHSKIGWEKLKVINMLNTALRDSSRSSFCQKKITEFFESSSTDEWRVPSKRLKQATSQRNLIRENSLNNPK